MNAAAAKGQVGIIGLGIMGGAIAKNLSAAGWQVIGHDIDASALRRGEGRRRRDRGRRGRGRRPRPTNILVSLPKPEALTDNRRRRSSRAKLPRRVIAELSTFSLDDKADGRDASCARPAT